MWLQHWLERRWYGDRAPEWPLRALAWLFARLVARRRAAFNAGKRRRYRADKPVLVVGNLTVGGVGKTPLVIALVRALQQRGLRVGVVSRGYGRNSRGLLRVDAASSADQVGDEPKLIQQSCDCPVVVAESRSEAVRELLKTPAVDLVIADDGLQHYAMWRSPWSMAPAAGATVGCCRLARCVNQSSDWLSATCGFAPVTIEVGKR